MYFTKAINRHYIIFQVLILLSYPFAITNAQTKTSFVSISSNEGLPSDEIKKVFQDAKGFMWFATPEGLIRYDGYDFRIFSTANYLSKGLITNNFMDIAEDSKGNLWCATDHGVGKLNGQTELFEFYNTKSKDWKSNEYDLINSIAIDKEDRIWIGTAGDGVVVLSPEDNKTISFSNQTAGLNMTSNWITKVYCDSNNNSWICSWEGGLTLINLDQRIQVSWQGLNDDLSFISYSPFSIHEAGNNKYWMGLWGKGIVEFELTESQHISLIKQINEEMIRGTTAPENIVYDIDLDNDNNLWIGTPYGALKINNPESANHTIERLNNKTSNGGIAQYEAFSVLCDKTGIIWFGTMAGVNILDPYTTIFTPYTIPESTHSIFSQAVTAFTKDLWGRTLVGVRSIGFGSYNLATQEFVPFTQIKPYSKLNPELNTINCFFWDNNDYLWLGTRYLGLIKLDPRNGNTIEINASNKQFDFDPEQVQDIIQDHLGNLWVGTDKGLFKIIPFKPVGFGNFSIVKYTHEPNNPLSLSSNRISKIVEDSRHNIWVSTYDKGLNRLTSEIQTHLPVTFQRYTTGESAANGLTSDQIMTMYEDSQKYLWIGTAGGGIQKWDEANDEFKQIKEINDVVGDAIVGINEDSENNLWLSTNQGLIKMSHKNGVYQYHSFKQINGLQSNNFIKGAVFRDQQNRLYFGGNKGFNYFDPLSIKANPNIPPTAITEIRVMNQIQPVPDDDDEPLVLAHNQNSISVTFSALSYSLPLSNKYATQLVGVDDQWRITDADMRTVTYANLKPGSYTLLIKASNSNGIWNDNARKLYITIKPAPYLTWWALILYTLSVGMVLLILIRKERRNVRTKQELEIEHLENERSEKLIAQKKQLFANISNEFISPLNILSVLVENWKQKKAIPLPQDLTLAQRNLNRLIRFNKQFLYYSNAEFNQISLTIEQADLQSITNDICDSFSLLMDKKGIEFTKEIDFSNQLVWFDQEKIDIILYNLLSHIIKATSNHGSVIIKLIQQTKANHQYASFTISNKNLHESSNKEKTDWDNNQEDSNISGSFGIELAIIKQLIELHGGELLMEQTLPYNQSMSFTIPVDREAYPSELTIKNKIKSSSVNFLKNQVTIEEEVITNLKNLSKYRQEKHAILIVEQDADLRKLLKTHLAPFFSIMEAHNGQTALNTISGQSIDLMITDVAIAGISGIELCKKVKSNSKNNMPVILTSAQVSEEERAACYLAGADSYIPKPFNINTLLVRMQTLIEQRNLFANISSSKSKRNAININNLTEKDKFLYEVKEAVEINLSDAGFSVKQLADILKVSNSMLYRKLLKLINLTPNAFIRKMRLIRATELLEESDLTISEIAFKCGFSDISYFGYAFRKEFGISPSAYQRNITQS